MATIDNELNRGGVSVLVPVYGAEKHIERCAISLFEQTYENIEFVFVNDCTKDNSIEVLLSVLERYPYRKTQVQIINHEVNKGVGEARNTLLDAATKEFLLFVDSDDYIDLGLVERLMTRQEEANADVVFFDWCDETIDGKVYIQAPEFEDTDQYTILFLRRLIHSAPWGKLIKTTLFKEHHIKVRCGINYAEDFLILAQALYYSHKTVTYHGVYYHYNTINEGSIMHGFSERLIKDQFIANDILYEFYKQIGGKYFDAFKYGIDFHIRSLFFMAIGYKHEKSFRMLQSSVKKQKISLLYFPIMYLPCHMAHIYCRTLTMLTNFKHRLRGKTID